MTSKTEKAAPHKQDPYSFVKSSLETKLRFLDKRIAERAEWLRGELARAIEGVKDPENGPTVNSLGVLQGNGVELDRWIGERAQLIETIKSLEWAQKEVA